MYPTGAADKQSIKDLWAYCFDEKEPFLSWYFDNVYKEKNTHIARENGKITAALQMLEYNICFHGVPVAASYMAGVSTAPEHRGKGYARVLIREALEAAREKGDVFTLLSPFNFKFYNNYGWECCYHVKRFKLSTDSLKPFSSSNNGFERVEQDFSTLERVYKHFCKDRNGCILRDVKEWRETLPPINSIYCYTRADAYLIFTINDGVINVMEIAYMTLEALHCILGIIYSHSAQASRVVLRTAADDILDFLLCERDVIVEVVPHIMARLIQPQKALEIIAADFSGSTVITVQDDYLPTNNRSYRIDGNSLEQSEIEGVRVDIGTLTQLALGHITEEQAFKLGKISAGFNGLFKAQKNYINMLGWV